MHLIQTNEPARYTQTHTNCSERVRWRTLVTHAHIGVCSRLNAIAIQLTSVSLIPEMSVDNFHFIAIMFMRPLVVADVAISATLSFFQFVRIFFCFLSLHIFFFGFEYAHYSLSTFRTMTAIGYAFAAQLWKCGDVWMTGQTYVNSYETRTKTKKKT